MINKLDSLVGESNETKEYHASSTAFTIVNAETGIFPGEEFFDQLPADLFLAEQEL